MQIAHNTFTRAVQRTSATSTRFGPGAHIPAVTTRRRRRTTSTRRPVIPWSRREAAPS